MTRSHSATLPHSRDIEEYTPGNGPINVPMQIAKRLLQGALLSLVTRTITPEQLKRRLLKPRLASDRTERDPHDPLKVFIRKLALDTQLLLPDSKLRWELEVNFHHSTLCDHRESTTSRTEVFQPTFAKISNKQALGHHLLLPHPPYPVTAAIHDPR